MWTFRAWQGYTADSGLDPENCAVITSITTQSPDIAQGVNKALDDDSLGAGDQGMMIGYATNETKEMIPPSLKLANDLTKRLEFVRKQGILPYLYPDGKAMVTIEYKNNRPKRIDTVVVSSQHSEKVDTSKLRQDILQHIIIPTANIDVKTKVLINPTGRFIVGGPCGDTGLTGRKIIVDTYGGICAHGGGAFSGKDATKVDRTGAYGARYIAKNIVSAGLADKCEVQVSYAIGKAYPVSVSVNTYGTGIADDEKIADAVQIVFDLRPSSLIKQFNMLNPIYRKLSCYGPFGRNDLDLPWENCDKVDELLNAINKKRILH